MAETCAGCGQELQKNGPVSAGEIEAAIKATWGRDLTSFWNHRIDGAELSIRGQKVVAELVSRAVPPSELFDYEGPQGVEYPISVVFLLNGQLYLKTGTADSYGSESWDGPLKLVQAKTKNVVVFE